RGGQEAGEGLPQLLLSPLESVEGLPGVGVEPPGPGVLPPPVPRFVAARILRVVPVEDPPWLDVSDVLDKVEVSPVDPPRHFVADAGRRSGRSPVLAGRSQERREVLVGELPVVLAVRP